MKNSLPSLSPFYLLGIAFLVLFPGAVSSAEPLALESEHYTVFYSKEVENIAGEVLEIAEAVWPSLAKAYDAYNNYRKIDIFLIDPGDYANGSAIYPFSLVNIYVTHINWVMRGRRNWLGNVVTHELAHIFTLRRAAHLSHFDDVLLGGGTTNSQFNYGFFVRWEPLVAPTWYVEGIAQFEAEIHGFDSWDSQRDLIVKDGYLTGTLPSLGEIEHFDGDWVASERVYNTGFAFLRFLKKKYGLEKIRQLAEPKPLFNFNYSVMKVLGKSLPDLYIDFKKSLTENYASYKELPKEEIFIQGGSYTHSLAFSPDQKFMAWIDNGDRAAPMNWIYWKNLETGKVGKEISPEPDEVLEEKTKSHPATQQRESYRPNKENPLATIRFPGVTPYQYGIPTVSLQEEPASRGGKINHPEYRSDRWGSSGLEFNKKSNRLLTTRTPYQTSTYDEEGSSPYKDIWEYDFKNDKWSRLTWNIRASYATYHPENQDILFVRLTNGTGNLAVLKPDGSIRQLTHFKEGQQIYNPKYAPKADSIYFTLGLDGNEGIVSVSAEMTAYSPFTALRDSVAFPDSVVLPDSQQFNFITALDSNLDRDLIFVGDTLFFSSYYNSKQYNIYALVRGDSSLYRVTNVRSQALEPKVFGNQIYYQGYEEQNFNLYRQPLELKATGFSITPTDTLPVKREKKLKYAESFGKKPAFTDIAWGISPYAILSPRFLTDSSFSSNLRLGIQAVYGNLNTAHAVSVEASKQVDLETILDYSVSYEGTWQNRPLRHTRFSWVPSLDYGIGHAVDHYEQSVLRFDGLVTTTDPNDPAQIPRIVYHSPTTGYTLVNNPNQPDLRPLYEKVWYARSVKQTYNYLYGQIALPLEFQTTGAYARISQSEVDGFNVYDYTTLANGALQWDTSYTVPNDEIQDQLFYSHYLLNLNRQWLTYKVGAKFPTGALLYVGLTKFWSTYAADYLTLTEADFNTCALREVKCGLTRQSLETFDPIDFNFTGLGVYSKDDVFTARLVSQVNFYSREFPGEPEFPVPTDVPDGNLYVLFHRLGLGRMPGYGYNLLYDKKDILRGTNMFWASASLEFPFKMYSFIPQYAMPFTSLNQIKLTLQADMGTVLNRAPQDIIPALNDGENELLMDIGATFSLNFQMFHRYPMTAYIQVFQPVNMLEWQKLGYYSRNALDEIEWIYYSDEVAQLSGPGASLTDRQEAFELEKGAVDYMNTINSLRWFFGITLGRF